MLKLFGDGNAGSSGGLGYGHGAVASVRYGGGVGACSESQRHPGRGEPAARRLLRTSFDGGRGRAHVGAAGGHVRDQGRSVHHLRAAGGPGEGSQRLHHRGAAQGDGRAEARAGPEGRGVLPSGAPVRQIRTLGPAAHPGAGGQGEGNVPRRRAGDPAAQGGSGEAQGNQDRRDVSPSSSAGSAGAIDPGGGIAGPSRPPPNNKKGEATWRRSSASTWERRTRWWRSSRGATPR